MANAGGRRVFEVTIAGITLKLKSSHDESFVQDLVSFVDSKVSEALPLTKTGSVQMAALLACLNIAEEHVLLKRKAKSELDHLEHKAQHILSHLESSPIPRAGLET